MILVDTSVWIDHLRRKNDALAGLLEAGEILSHPFVIGELALGEISQRTLVLEYLSQLPSATAASHDEILQFIERRRLFGRGIGYVDVHLLAAVELTPGGLLWTSDKRLHRTANDLGIALAQ